MNILSLLRALSHRNIRGGRRLRRMPIRQPSPYRPRFEALEDRRVLSSILMLPLGDGTFQLRVDGDAKANQVAIVGRGPGGQTNDYSLIVTCDQLQQTLNNVSEVVIDTRGGADTVLLTGQWSGVRSISADLGAGGDSVMFIDSFFAPPAKGSGPYIQIDTGSGDDKAAFDHNVFGGGVSLSVIGGSGDDLALLQCNDIAGSFDALVDLGVGDDTTMFMGNTLDGPAQLAVNGGAGNDRIEIGGEDNDGDDVAGMMHENQFKGSLALAITGGSGDDLALLLCNDIAGSFDASVDLGSNDDKATFDHNVFGGGVSLTITGGSGDDFVFIQCNGLIGAFDALVDLGSGDDAATFMGNTFGGPAQLAVNGGAGNDRIEIGGDGDAGMVYENQFKGGLTLIITGGSGDDIAGFLCNGISFSFDASVDLGKGDDTATFAGNTVTGSLHMSTFGGDGKDLVAVQDNGIGGPVDVLVDVGSGNDSAYVELSLADIDLSQKPVTVRILGGSGDDDLALAVKADPQVLAAANLLIDGGSGFDRGVGGPHVKVNNCEQ